MTGGSRAERVWYCDALRALAIALVVLLHTFADWRFLYFDASRTCYFILTSLQIITRVAVPIFFMLTGAFMLGRTREERYSSFLKKRVLKLLIPFVIISGVYYIFSLCQNGVAPSNVLWDFVVQFSNNGIKYHFWYMYAIILIYLLLPFLNKMILNLSKRNLQTLILVLASGNLVSTVAYISGSLGTALMTEWGFPNFLCYVNYLFLGYYLQHYGVERKWRKWLYLAGIAALIAMPVLDVALTKTVLTDALFVAGSLGPLITATAVFVWFQSVKWKWNNRWKRFFVLTTPLVFYIYMVHVFVMDLTKQAMLRVWTPRRFVEVCAFIVGEFVLTFVLSYLIALGIHKSTQLYGKLRKFRASRNATADVGRREIAR